ncbi:MAG: hypothetical protein G01um10147_972 [Microgenomates group bacterium Gr01-1014_7]|nr:MAG: hypothetical protein G01um10147_972 [Microgenomates group bacterium Gr01-1014_7]
MIMTIIIFILSVLGFSNAFYLYWQHKREVNTGQKMFCLIGGDCGAVVGSKYGKTFGIKNEIIGMIYYALLGIYILTGIVLPPIKIIAGVAALFSLYLLYIQVVVLKKFCSWCLIAIAINLLIFYFLK